MHAPADTRRSQGNELQPRKKYTISKDMRAKNARYMKSLLVLAAMLAVGAFVAPVLARAGSSAPSLATVSAGQTAANLHPIVVKGRKVLPLPVALEVVKAALKRPVSFARKDLGKLVCRFEPITGTHFQTLNCETNCQRLIDHDAAAMHAFIGPGACGAAGESAVQTTGKAVVNFMNLHRINPGALRALLRKLPPVNSSYVFRVTDSKGRPVKDYHIKDGNVVKIKKYVYKKKAGSAKP